jgi:fumarate hydratase class II
MTRIEADSLGKVELPDDAYWGPTTQRALNNFQIGGYLSQDNEAEQMPFQVIRAIIQIKKACAMVNTDLTSDQSNAIVEAADKLLRRSNEELRRFFPLPIWQTGSGTASNMNVNEIIANFCIRPLNVHPNDTVNRGQSSNDVFPSAIHIAAFLGSAALISAIDAIIETFDSLITKYGDTVVIGRTHLQDATPLTLGNQLSAYKEAFICSRRGINEARSELLKLSIGGTAVGTGLNAPQGFGDAVAKQLNKNLGLGESEQFEPDLNPYFQLSMRTGLTNFHASLKTLATTCLKLGNDIRFRVSGPRTGLQELLIPAGEPGSSIMPGKVNPTQAEALVQVAVQVLGNDVAVSTAASLGNFELNTYLPLIISNVLRSTTLLTDSLTSFDEKLLQGLRPNEKVLLKNAQESLMLATSLSPLIGYAQASRVAKNALEKDISLLDSALELTDIDSETLEELLQPQNCM